MSEPYRPGGLPAHGQPYPVAPQEHPQGVTVLVLGILGLFVGVCAPFAWVMGNRALKEIRASGVHYANEQQIVIGRILGMIITIVMIVALVLGLLAAVGLTIFAVNTSG